MNKHIGSHFEDFLKEENLYDEVEAVAIKRVVAFQVKKALEQCDLSKTDMAKKMGTSRSALERLLDEKNTSVTLLTLIKAANVLGKKVKIQFG